MNDNVVDAIGGRADSNGASTGLHVALVTPWETGGGIANYSKRLRDSLDAAGINVSIVPIRHPETANPFRFDNTVTAIPNDVDVVHVQYEAGVFGRFGVSGVCTPSFYVRLLRLDAPVVTTLHEVHRSYPGRGTIGTAAVKSRDWVVERITLAASDTVVVHTDEVLNVLRDRHGDGCRLRKLRHPVDDPVAPPLARDIARDQMDIDADTVLLTFGWVEPKKRYEDVVRALPDLDEVSYLIAGEPRYDSDKQVLENVFALANRLGVRDRVHHVGYVADEDLPALFGATDLTVVPYEQVTQSGAANTALAYHCPVLATALPAFEELAADYECVRTYDCPGDIAAAVRAATTADARERIRTSAKRYVDQETWTKFVDETAALYETAVNNAADSPPSSTILRC
jgi:glycosyltransferase involved in cell wall biosynthesis